MIETNGQHPFIAATAFALDWMTALAEHNFKQLDALVDDPGPPPPLSGFFEHPDFQQAWPLGPNEMESWNLRFYRDDEVFSMELDVPFPREEFRPLLAKFDFYQEGTLLLVVFEGLFFQ